jgi:uncharacterized membrane protein
MICFTMKRQSEDEMHKDPDNWKGPFYYNPRDKRLFVPRKMAGAGYGLNYANPEAKWIWILVILAMVLVAVYSVRA